MSERPTEASESPDAELVRLRAALRSEQDKVAALQADVQNLKVNQVEIVRHFLTECCTASESASLSARPHFRRASSLTLADLFLTSLTSLIAAQFIVNS